MAAIMHRCKCGHLDCVHSGVTGACTALCTCPQLDPGPPELVPTWSAQGSATGPTVLDPDVLAPGTCDPPGLGTLCACDACQHLYRTLTTTAA